MKGPKVFAVLIGILSLIFVRESNAQEKAVKLGEIVVTATKTPHLLKDVPIETVVITEEDIEKSNAQTVSDLLSDIPGLFIHAENTPGISAWRSKIRGLDFNSGYGLILIDGQRVKGGGMGEYGIGLNQIPLEMIDRIEIVKGPSSVLYGSDALAGVVNIITKSPSKRPEFGLEGAAGSHNVYIGNACLSGGAGKLGGLINLNHEESDVGKYGYRSGREEDYHRNRLDTKFYYDLTGDIKLSLGVDIEDWDRKRKYSSGMRRHTEKHKYRVSPGLDVRFDDGSSLKLHGYWFDWDFDTKERGGLSHFTPMQGDMYYREGEIQYTRPLGKSHVITGGAEYLEEELDYNLSQKTIDTKSSYIQDEMNFLLWRPLTVVLGGRVDDHSQFGTEFCPRLSLMLEATGQTRIRASAGRAFKSPNIRQLYYNQPFHHGTYWFRSNPGLDAEYSWGYSLGIEQVFKERYLVNLTFFRNDINDKVIWEESNETIEGEPVKIAKNIARSHTQGIEAGLRADIFRGFYAILGYAYLNTEDEETGKVLTYCPKNTFSLKLIYDCQPLGVTFSARTQYVDKMYKNTENTKETEDYWLADAKLIKELTEYASVSAEANNIFGSDYGEPERDWAGCTFLTRLKLAF